MIYSPYPFAVDGGGTFFMMALLCFIVEKECGKPVEQDIETAKTRRTVVPEEAWRRFLKISTLSNTVYMIRRHKIVENMGKSFEKVLKFL